MIILAKGVCEMADSADIKSQLTKAGYKFSVWSRREVRELCNVIHDEEAIINASNGYYEGGFALLVGTDHRLILVDCKPMYLTLDTLAYSTIQEVTLNYRLLNSSINIYTSNKCMVFRSWNHDSLRAILTYTQKRIIENRNGNNQILGQPQFVQQYQVPFMPTMPQRDAQSSSYSSTPTPSVSTAVPADNGLTISTDGSYTSGRTTYGRHPIFSRHKLVHRYL